MVLVCTESLRAYTVCCIPDSGGEGQSAPLLSVYLSEVRIPEQGGCINGGQFPALGYGKMPMITSSKRGHNSDKGYMCLGKSLG